MDRITNKNNILKICAGNDFSIIVQITEYDTEAGAWVNYDLSAVSDVHMCLIAQNGKRIKLPITVNGNGTVSAAIQSAYLQKTTYGIEITWLTDSLNRRTYSPCLLQIVTSTAESSSNIAEYESNDAYHFNIKMMSDVAILSIGKISDEYITESELDDALSSYATIASVDTQISTLWNDANDTFIDNDELDEALSSYVTNSSLDEMSYATTQYVDDAISDIDLSDYYTKSEVDTTLSSYGTSLYGKGWKIVANPNYILSYQVQLKNDDNVLSEVWIPAHNKTKNTNNEWYTPFWSALIRSDDYISMLNGLDTLSTIQSDYINNDTLNTTLSSYINDAAYDSTNHNILLKNGSTVIVTIDASPFIIDGMVENVQIINDNLVISFNTDAGKQDISIPISQIFDASNYYTKNEIDVTLSSYATTQYVDGEIADIDLSSYVTTDELSNAGYVTAAYVGTYIDSLDSRVSYLEQHQGGDVDLSAYVKQTTLDTTLASYVKQTTLDTTLASYVTYLDWDNSNEAIAYELTNNRLDHQTINSNFSNYYTKTETDGRYATQSWANNKFVEQNESENQNQAIAAAFASSVQSTTVHNIWTGSQNDYDAITTKDTNTLYVIL